MLNFLYSLIIYPITQILDIAFMITQRAFGNNGLSVISVSIAVSVLCLPLYLIAEARQKQEREIQNRMRLKISKIKAVFKGDERYMILNTYYRQNHYHPMYAMRSSLGLLIQIPFFIAAYRYLSHLDALKGSSFWFIRDLGAPDGLLQFGGVAINVLPVLMTAVNYAAAWVYTASLSKKEAAQLYAMAAVFLILLYNSPSALTLYWMCNNIFSLGKNIVAKIRPPQKVLYIFLCVLSGLAAIFFLFVFDKGYYMKRAVLAACFLLLPLLPLFRVALGKMEQKIFSNATPQAGVFAAGAGILFLLTGVCIPSALVSSSIEEFSFINPFTSPNSFIRATLFQAAGCFLFWPACLYALFPKKVKFYMTFLCAAAGFAALVNTYLFPGKYGFLSINLTLSAPIFSQKTYIVLLEIFVLIAVLCLIFFLLIRDGRNRLLFSIQVVSLCALAVFAVFNGIKIQTDFARYSRTAVQDSSTARNSPLDPVFTFSRTGKNVLVMMLDRAISAYLPYILEEKPELNEGLSGFVWYSNTVSLGSITISGSPPLFGGYDYAPEKFGKNTGVPLVEKHNQALLVMPRLFSENGFRVTVTDPSWANYNYKSDISIYNDYPDIKADKIIGKYTKRWLGDNPDVDVFNAAEFLTANLLRFSFLRISPPFLRFFIYDDGKWIVKIGDHEGFPLLTLDEYIALAVLPEITVFDDGPGTMSIITNQLTHENALMQPPEYRPAAQPVITGSGRFADNSAYHVNMAALLLAAKFFDRLKANGVYDNTRIIMAADHGWNYGDIFPDLILPDNENVVAYNPLLMVKDFGSRGSVRTSNAFMTNADTPFLAAEDVIPDARNPWTGNLLEGGKDSGVYVFTSGLWSPDLHSKYAFKIQDNNFLRVHTNIFDMANWSMTSPP